MKEIVARIELLGEEDLQRRLVRTLGVVATAGCRLPHRRVMELMRSAGGQVDDATAIIRMPRELMEHTIRHTSPGTPFRTGRTALRPVPVRSGELRFGRAIRPSSWTTRPSTGGRAPSRT